MLGHGSQGARSRQEEKERLISLSASAECIAGGENWGRQPHRQGLVRYAAGMKTRWLMPIVFVAIGLQFFGGQPLAVFVASLVAIVPLVELMGTATERLARRLGAVVGGLLNSTLSNAPELIIGMAALHNGLGRVVKASLTGSIMVNLLVGLGCALVVGGLKFGPRPFDRKRLRAAGLMLMMCGLCFIVPAVFRIGTPEGTRDLSLELSVILLALYAGNVLVNIFGHQDESLTPEADVGEGQPTASVRSLGALAIAAVLLAFVSDALSESLSPTAKSLGLSDTFSGIVLLGGVGGIGEVLTAIRFARQGKQELVMAATVGSTIQMVLLVAPLLVFTGVVIGEPMNLAFSVFEVVAIVLAIVIAREIMNAGQANWMEGLVLLATYLILAIGFYHLPDGVVARDRMAAEGEVVAPLLDPGPATTPER
ncbi:MAG: calcium/proton exchanger [Planctomycetia bacterium]|nr:calcium/proton exchanger [Planctomycetia bacterium]